MVGVCVGELVGNVWERWFGTHPAEQSEAPSASELVVQLEIQWEVALALWSDGEQESWWEEEALALWWAAPCQRSGSGGYHSS